MATATSSLICIMYLYNSVHGYNDGRSVRKERIYLSKVSLNLCFYVFVSTTVSAHHHDHANPLITTMYVPSCYCHLTWV